MPSFLYKIYDPTGATFLAVLDPESILSDVRFSHAIDAAQGQLTTQ